MAVGKLDLQFFNRKMKFRKAITSPKPVFTTEMAVKPPFVYLTMAVGRIEL